MMLLMNKNDGVQANGQYNSAEVIRIESIITLTNCSITSITMAL
jgi:hypothetical protein